MMLLLVDRAPSFILRLGNRALISLPIVMLLLVVVTTSYRFYHTLQQERQWHYQQQLALKNHRIWQAFETDIVFRMGLPFGKEKAVLSECDGFCSLNEIRTQKWLDHYQYTYQDQLETLRWRFTKMAPTSPFYRLCAQQYEVGEMQCWWYQENNEKGILRIIGHMPFFL